MNDHMPLIALRQHNAGSKGTILCMPGAGDGVTRFVALVKAIREGFAIYGLQPKGLVADQEPYASIDAMGHEYIEMISKKAIQGPYYLIGHSFGGYVALNVAKRLKELGCEVASLVLLDVTYPDGSNTQKSRVESLSSLVETMELASGKCFNLSLDDLASMSDEDYLRVLHAKMVDSDLLPKKSSSESIRGMVRLFVANNNMQYLPKEIYEGPALLVNALYAKESKRERFDNFERWRKLIPGLKCMESPGNHITVLGEENVRVLAKTLEKIWFFDR